MEKHTKEQEAQIEKIDRAISELVYEKTQMIKAYNYYHGKRDPSQFLHLEENYGIGSPTSVKFVPLVRKHIDVLVGEYLTIPVLPKVSCKDADTLTKINESKSQYINDSIKKEIQEHLRNILKGSDPAEMNFKKKMEELRNTLESNFISEYEVAAQNVVDWILQNRDIDFITKRKDILIDLLITGSCYYRTLKSPSGTGVEFKALNPLHTFIERNVNSSYSKDSQRAVVRSYLTKNEILEEFGEYLTKEDIESLDKKDSEEVNSIYSIGVDSIIHTSDEESDGILSGWEVAPSYDNDSYYNMNRYIVYDVEWLQTEKKSKRSSKYRTDRYRGIRIGDEIYILMGKVKDVSRSKSEPDKCGLSINGTFYADRNGNPFSLMLSTADLQDKFDVLNFYRDTVIAESGIAGDWVDLAYIPTVLGSDLVERLMKWKAYKKQGMALIDSSQEGEAPMNTTFGGYDDTLKLNTIQALDLAIQRVEETCSTITGVFKEKLGGIEQRDAVTNVQVGVRQSSYITKQYYFLMDTMTREMLLDTLDICKVVFKKGITGTLVLGDRYNMIFTALPEHFTVSDHDIHITETSEVLKEFETMKQLGMEFANNGLVEPEVVIEILTAKSLTKMKQEVTKSINKIKEENNNVAEMQQQLEQAEEQMKQMSRELEKAQRALENSNQEKLALDREKMQNEKELGWYKARNEKQYNEEKVKLDQKHIEAEILELYDGNPHNNEIKNKRD